MQAPEQPPYAGAFAACPAATLLLDLELRITDANDAYLRVVERRRDDLVGRLVVEAFPTSPEAPGGATALEDSMRAALATGRPDRMPLLHYDVESEPGSRRFEERWWAVVNVPVHDGAGAAAGVLNVVEDVTELLREQSRTQQARDAVHDLEQRTSALQQDLLARSAALLRAHEAEARASRRLAGLAQVALDLASAQTLEDLVDVVIDRGLVVLEADGGAVAVLDADGETLRLTMTDSLGERAGRAYGELSLDGPLPASVAARTRAPVLVRDREEGLAQAPEMAGVHDTTGKVAWASLPLLVGGRLLGSVTAGWEERQDFDPVDVELLEAFAAQCAQALDRLLRLQAERRSAAVRVRMSEALQRSLLSDPIQPDHLQLVARYLPAAHESQVGGDWYDAFVTSAGLTSLVIGDVAGHDRDAAVSMAQVRNTLRGVGHALGEPPAAVLSALDRAMRDLGVDALATAVLATVEQSPEQAQQGLRTVRWSNAGHPPPLLLHTDGRIEELATERAELMLGVDPAARRTETVVTVRRGATLLLYTDGLVEGRDLPLDEGTARLREALAELADRPLAELCDEVIARLRPEGLQDDVALVALRLHPEDRPRPREAGPRHVPPRFS